MSNITETVLQDSQLGKKSQYPSHYNPSLLFALPRQPKRDEIQIPTPLPFRGVDVWTAYEVSWLNFKGKPIVAIADVRFPIESEKIIESKSFKLYLNSLNHSKFSSFSEVQSVLQKDLSAASQSTVVVRLHSLDALSSRIEAPDGLCLDSLDIECTDFEVNKNIIQTHDTEVSEALYTNLLKSNCLVTGQPDWGSIQIIYTGKKINHESLLKYIVSFRNHYEFHEQCVERIFMDIYKTCYPSVLTVYARYTRRGGLDINPFRTSLPVVPDLENNRFVRQ